MNRSGTLVTVDGRTALRFERTYARPVERVWRAVTDPDEMAAWFPAAVIGERAEGADLVFDDDAHRADARSEGEPRRADGPMFRGTVLVWDPPARFHLTWGGEELRLDLTPTDEGCRLVFTQLISHPSVAARNGAGWHVCLRELDRALGEDHAAPASWEAEYDDYLDRMGPALGERAGGALRWERATHVDVDRVRTAVTDRAERTAWGAPAEAGPAERWDVRRAEVGSTLTLTLTEGVDDPTEASRWHALLLQLDMYLAAGQLVPAAPDRWVEAYASALA